MVWRISCLEYSFPQYSFPCFIDMTKNESGWSLILGNHQHTHTHTQLSRRFGWSKCGSVSLSQAQWDITITLERASQSPSYILVWTHTHTHTHNNALTLTYRCYLLKCCSVLFIRLPIMQPQSSLRILTMKLPLTMFCQWQLPSLFFQTNIVNGLPNVTFRILFLCAYTVREGELNMISTKAILTNNLLPSKSLNAPLYLLGNWNCCFYTEQMARLWPNHGTALGFHHCTVCKSLRGIVQ